MQQAACGRDDSGPRRLTIFQRLLLSIISRRLQGSAPGLAGISHTVGLAGLNIPVSVLQISFRISSIPLSPSLCVILRPQGAPGVLKREGCGEGSRYAHPSHLLGSSLSSHKGDTTNTVAFLHGRGCKVEGCTGYRSHESWLVGGCLLNSQGFCETVITLVACTQAWQDIYSMEIGKCYKSRLCANPPPSHPTTPRPGDLFVKHQHSPGRG